MDPDPDPGGPKTCVSGGSGSATLGAGCSVVPGSVLGDEEVEEGEGHRVTGEHVVATRPHSLGDEEEKSCVVDPDLH
jgi:hypothetical protein